MLGVEAASQELHNYLYMGKPLSSFTFFSSDVNLDYMLPAILPSEQANFDERKWSLGKGVD